MYSRRVYICAALDHHSAILLARVGEPHPHCFPPRVFAVQDDYGRIRDDCGSLRQFGHSPVGSPGPFPIVGPNVRGRSALSIDRAREAFRGETVEPTAHPVRRRGFRSGALQQKWSRHVPLHIKAGTEIACEEE